MRLYNAKIVGKNTLPENFRLLVSGPTGCGKTTFVKKLLQSKRLKKKIRHVYYCYPDSFDSPPVDWHTIPDLIVTYCPFLPDHEFIKDLKKNSLLVLDDVFDSAIKSRAISDALRIHSRRRFSMVLITQNFFDSGQHSVSMRNQLNAVVLFRNFGNVRTNRQVADQLDVKSQFLQAEKATETRKYDPIVILSSEIVSTPEMRVQTQFLHPCMSYCYK